MTDELARYLLPEHQREQQRFIDRAEEDLVCAIHCWRNRANGYVPLVNICYLLLEAIEKWLKAFISTQNINEPIKGKDSHNLFRYFQVAIVLEPEFQLIEESIKATDPLLLSHQFYVDLRYNETPQEIEIYIATLVPAAFDTRRVVKKFLTRRQDEPDQI